MYMLRRLEDGHVARHSGGWTTNMQEVRTFRSRNGARQCRDARGVWHAERALQEDFRRECPDCQKQRWRTCEAHEKALLVARNAAFYARYEIVPVTIEEVKAVEVVEADRVLRERRATPTEPEL